ncbi:PREDICTED: uncharacterized protein LOC105452220 isoform X2 [Wasmannia auropunctata]|uniref:uncharacterized protein LOC105452220 isoform X2 n=1 Tax=Wasmannia auropunctata TaxID=64793 RepID=UPI0005F05DCF|nr:PREDICTED: uncharacterized protein LOC105452220 isoform X2 [Wasmannia auropunctata]
MYGLLCIISETIYFFEATSVLQNHIMQHAESRTTGARDMSLYYKTPLMFIVHVKKTHDTFETTKFARFSNSICRSLHSDSEKS